MSELKMPKIFRNALIISSLLVTAGYSSAQVQTVTGTFSVAELSAGQSTELSVSYDAVDSDAVAAYVTGFGMRTHFDSSMLEIGTFRSRTVGNQGLQVKDDTENWDNDSSTDKFLLSVWADISNVQHGWPAFIEIDNSSGDCFRDENDECEVTYVELPKEILTVPFTTSSVYNGANINFTFSSIASGYSAVGEPVTITKIPGTVSTLSDLTASYPAFVTAAPAINIPVNKIGNGPDATINTNDDVTVKGSYVAGDLTFVRPPVNLEAPAAKWCPAKDSNGDGCTAQVTVLPKTPHGWEISLASEECNLQRQRLGVPLKMVDYPLELKLRLI